jgi:hypothetical protein
VTKLAVLVVVATAACAVTPGAPVDPPPSSDAGMIVEDAQTVDAAVTPPPSDDDAGTPPATKLTNENALSSWQFPISSYTTGSEAGRVDDLRRVGGAIYVGGNFVVAADHQNHTAARTYLAAIDPNGVLLPFAPTLDGRVYAIASCGTTIYVGGEFTTVNGAAHSRLVAFDTTTGNVSSAIGDMKIDGTVRAIACTSDALYFGGAFTHVAGQARTRAAKLDLSNGASLDSSWAISFADDDVRGVLLDPPTHRVILAGWFSKHITAVTDSDASASTWADNASAEVLDIAIDGTSLYAAMGGPGGTALAYDLATGKQRWYYMTDGNCQAVDVVAGYPIFGMHGDNVAPDPNEKLDEYGTSKRIPRAKIFMLDPQTGTLQSWAPDLASNASPLGVWALRAFGGDLYVGGDFTKVAGADQERFAIFR